MCCCLSCTPSWGPGPQPRHMPWPRIKPAIFPFVGWRPTHWATPVRGFPHHSCLRLLLAHQLPYYSLTTQMVCLAADSRENWLIRLIGQMLFFFSEKLSVADRALSMWTRFLPLIPDPSTNGVHLPVPALCALILHQPSMARWWIYEFLGKVVIISSQFKLCHVKAHGMV